MIPDHIYTIDPKVDNEERRHTEEVMATTTAFLKAFGDMGAGNMPPRHDPEQARQQRMHRHGFN